MEANANSPDEIKGAVEARANSRVDVVIVLQTGLLLTLGRQIAELAVAKRLPTVYGYREHVVAGGLISYGVDLRWCYRRGAYFVDKILHGTPPGELPVEFPTEISCRSISRRRKRSESQSLRSFWAWPMR